LEAVEEPLPTQQELAQVAMVELESTLLLEQ